MLRPSLPVPQPVDTFIGRAEELQTVKTLLATHRLVTLTGAAGIGKTRLAVRVAEELAPSFPDGVCFVALADVTDPALVPQAVASALGLREQPDRSLLQTLTDALASRTLLLVWDNCDYLVKASRALAQFVLGACPQVKVLTTSRQSLHISGEILHTVPPFGVPETDSVAPGVRGATELVRTSEALQLFQQRAREKLPEFEITPDNVAALAQICRRLDGIPLALELAAGRIRELSADQIAARLDERFRLLVGGSSALTYQQTLATAIGWSYDLLSEPERKLMARLSVFAGGWDLEAAEQVCSDSVGSRQYAGTPRREGDDSEEDPSSLSTACSLMPTDVLDLLTGLIDKSWIVSETLAAGGRRYRFLEMVRDYSQERLKEAGAAAELRARHAEFYLRLAEAAETALTGSVRAAWLDRLENEYENLRAALTWCRAGDSEAPGGAEMGLRLAGALVQFWEVRGYLSEGRSYLAGALDREGAGEPTRERAKALNGAAVLAWMQGDAGAARALFEESLAIERSSGDRRGVAWSVHQLGHVAAEHGEYEMARGLYEESLVMFREVGDKPGIAASLADQGNMALKQGSYDAARSLYEESLGISRELGNRVSVAISLNNLGKIAREQGDFQAARALHAESLAIRRELGDKGGIPWSLEAFARLSAPADPERAARLWGAAEGLRDSLGLPLPPNEREEYDRHRTAAWEALGEEAFASAWAAGQAMTLDQAAAYALRDGEEAEPDTSATGGRRSGGAPATMPPFPLLTTKLEPPALSPSLLPRPRLMARFGRGAPAGGHAARVVALVASAGSGKSSLVSQWCQQYAEAGCQGSGRITWLSLDAEDDDPERFLQYLSTALERVAPAVTAPVRALREAAERPSPENRLALLLNGVAALEQPVTLVLDDYHEIEATAVHHLVTFLVEHLPPTLFLILATRSDPPLPLARLRLQGRLIEIRDEELRFTHDEATAFLNERMGLTLPPALVDRLSERTEGWIAGLQMAALSLQGETDPSGFLDAFAGSHRFLVEYLFEEVLQRQPPEVQAFLGQTAFLDRLCGPLCDAVTGEPGGQAMLQQLQAANLFLVPLDREGRWYRYHHLFADVLRARLLSSDTEETAALHRRAAAWYEKEGMIVEAIEHMLAGGEFEHAVHLVERQSGDLRRKGEAEQVVARLERYLEPTVQQKRHGSDLEARLLLAILHWEANRREQAVTVLEPALTPAEQEGSVRLFLEAGAALVPALRQAAAQGIAPEFAGKLLTALSDGKHSAGMPPASGSSTLIEPLSEREVEVLRLLAVGLPNKEIAEQLYLAVGTVKRHVFNLYGKLGVTSRTSAVARAREFGLL